MATNPTRFDRWHCSSVTQQHCNTTHKRPSRIVSREKEFCDNLVSYGTGNFSKQKFGESKSGRTNIKNYFLVLSQVFDEQGVCARTNIFLFRVILSSLLRTFSYRKLTFGYLLFFPNTTGPFEGLESATPSWTASGTPRWSGSTKLVPPKDSSATYVSSNSPRTAD